MILVNKKTGVRYSCGVLLNNKETRYFQTSDKVLNVTINGQKAKLVLNPTRINNRTNFAVADKKGKIINFWSDNKDLYAIAQSGENNLTFNLVGSNQEYNLSFDAETPSVDPKSDNKGNAKPEPQKAAYQPPMGKAATIASPSA